MSVFRRAATVLLTVLLLAAPAAVQARASWFARPQAAPARPIPPGPAMWVIRDADSTLYLFGTVHVMKPGQTWRSPRIDAALASSDELILEMAEVGDDDVLIPLVTRYGLMPGVRLTEHLSPTVRAKLAAAAAAMDTDVRRFDPMRPWLVSLQLTIGSLSRAGYAADHGVDRALKADAIAAGKPVRGFETPEQQIRFFADLAPRDEADLLAQSLHEFDQAPFMLDRLSRAWMAGDPRQLKRYLVDDWKREQPALYRQLIVRRNAAWARQIEARLAGSGTSFIAVGAGHLVGPDSVQAQLRRHGIRSERG